MNPARILFEITGTDRIRFLQDLVTNDVAHLSDRLTYAALLSPQGKYLFDFFLFQRGDTIFLDVASDRAAELSARLAMYRLRADVEIAPSDLQVSRGFGSIPEFAMLDPRHPELGWRCYSHTPHATSVNDWNAIRVSHLIPESGFELISGESYILEMGFERLNGVDFKKGCYVGQEVTARMKHKTNLRKGLARVVLGGHAEAGAEITVDGRKIGALTTVSGNRALAYLRLDQVAQGMVAGDVGVAPDRD